MFMMLIIVVVVVRENECTPSEDTVNSNDHGDVGGQRRQCVRPEYDDDDGDGSHREWEDSQMDS